MTDVSAIVPTLNRPRLLARALDAALGQEGVELEVIVVDDGSPEGTYASVAALRDPRVRVIRHAARRGVSAARNTGIGAASGRWLAFLDDDDRWLPRRLAELVALAESERADFAYNDVSVVDREGRPLWTSRTPPAERLLGALRASAAIIAPSAVVGKAELIARVGGFDTRLAYFADWDQWLRMARGGRAARLPEVLVEYSLHEGSMLVERQIDILRELAYLREKHPEISDDAIIDNTRWMADRLQSYGYFSRAGTIYVRQGIRRRDPRLVGRGLITMCGRHALGVASRVLKLRRAIGDARTRRAPH